MYLPDLHTHLSRTYLAFSDLMRRLEVQAQAEREQQREVTHHRLRTELATIDLLPLTNPADQH